MLRFLEVVTGLLTVLLFISVFSYVLWVNVHSRLRRERKQDEIDRSIKW